MLILSNEFFAWSFEVFIQSLKKRMSDPLLQRMDKLMDFIDQVLAHDDMKKGAKLKSKNMDESKDDEKRSNVYDDPKYSNYLDNQWKKNRKQELSVLKQWKLKYRADYVIDANIERPVGHSTHNLFLKDKKSKQRFLITHHQSHKCDYKKLAKILKGKGFKIKELRMDSPQNREENLRKYFGFIKGCITSLSFLNITDYDKENGVKWIVDSSIVDGDDLVICAGCRDPVDHTQHHVVDISAAKHVELIKSIGVEPVIIDFE